MAGEGTRKKSRKKESLSPGEKRRLRQLPATAVRITLGISQQNKWEGAAAGKGLYVRVTHTPNSIIYKHY